jgi:uncharacterized protein
VSGRRALTVFVADLQKHPGSRRTEQIPVELPDLAISTSRVPEDATILIDVVVESLSSSISVAGTITIPWSGDCRRCLGDANGVVVADVKEIFEGRPTDGKTYPLGGDHIDLEPMVRDAVLLSLPLAPLCSPDCAGPAPEVVPVSTAVDEPVPGEPLDEPAPPADPRWSALDDLRFD